jgi:hypothetical protein
MEVLMREDKINPSSQVTNSKAQGVEVPVRSVAPFDAAWHSALSTTVADEWNSPEDEAAFDDL